MKIKDGPLKGYEIKFAPQDGVNSYPEGIGKVLEAVGYPEAFVSDMSIIGDFSLTDEELAAASEKLGIPLSHDDYIFVVAVKVSEKLN